MATSLWLKATYNIMGHTDSRLVTGTDLPKIRAEYNRLRCVRYSKMGARNKLVRYAEYKMQHRQYSDQGTFNLDFLTAEGLRVWELLKTFAGNVPRFRNVSAKGFTVRYIDRKSVV